MSMGDIIQFRPLTGILCHACNRRMAWLKDDNIIRCTHEECGKGFLKSDHEMEVRIEDGQTIIERRG